MATTSRGYRKIADNENDKAQAVNDALEDINADVAYVAAQGGGGGNGGGGVAPVVTTINVPANRAEWTPTDLSVTPGSATKIDVTGLITNTVNQTPYGPETYAGGSATWIVLPEGQTPVGRMDAQKFWRESRDIDDSVLGKIWVRINNSESYDNSGSFDFTFTQFADASALSALAPVNRSKISALWTVLNQFKLVTNQSIASEQTARTNADSVLQTNIDAKNDSNTFALDVTNNNAPSLLRNVLANIWAAIQGKINDSARGVTGGVANYDDARFCQGVALAQSGKPAAAARLDKFMVPRAMQTSNSAADFVFYADTAATADTLIYIQRAPAATPTSFVTIATLRFAAGSTNAVAESITATTWATRDFVRLWGPTTADATLSDISGTIMGVLI